MDNQLARGWTTSWPCFQEKVDNQLTPQHIYIYIDSLTHHQMGTFWLRDFKKHRERRKQGETTKMRKRNQKKQESSSNIFDEHFCIREWGAPKWWCVSHMIWYNMKWYHMIYTYIHIYIFIYVYIYMLVSQSIVHLFPVLGLVYSPPFLLPKFRHIIVNHFLPVFASKICWQQPKRELVYSPPLG